MASNNEKMVKACRDASNANIPNWISIRKAKNCIFSRRNGHVGKIVLGYSIRLRIFGIEII